MKKLSFEEALKQYIEVNGVPTLDEFIEIYRMYRKTLKDYKWNSFIEFIHWFK